MTTRHEVPGPLPPAAVAAGPIPSRPLARADAGPAAASWMLLLGVAAVWIAFWAWTGVCLEDALITFRVAGNLAHGDGMVFNVGERVQASTTPLFTLLLALVGLVDTDWIPPAAVLCGVVFGLGLLVCTQRILLRLGAPWPVAWFACLFVALHPRMVIAATGGMETSLVVFWMAASLLAALSGRYLLGALACALLILTRPDGLLWTLAMAAWLVWRTRGRGCRPLLVPAAAGISVVATWGVIAWLYFGSAIPNSMAAKQVLYQDSRPPLTDLATLTSYVHWGIGAIRLDLGEHAWWQRGMVALWLGLAGVGLWRARRGPHGPTVALLAGYTAAFVGAFWFGRAPMNFFWYAVPITWALLTLGGLGLAGPRAADGAPRAPGSRLRVLAQGCIVAISLATLAVAHVRHWRQVRDFQANEDGTRRRLGLWLRDNTPPRATVLMEAIGYQGYYSGRNVIDLAGLASPTVVEAGRTSRTNHERFWRILDQLSPDYLVLRASEVADNRLYHGGAMFASDEQRQRFTTGYPEVARFRAPIPDPELYGPDIELVVYRRLAEPAPQGR